MPLSRLQKGPSELKGGVQREALSYAGVSVLQRHLPAHVLCKGKWGRGA